MKRLLSITLALSLLGSSVAMANGYQGGGYGEHRGNGYSTPYRGGYGYRDRGDNTAAAVGVGILALGLFAALASQHNNDHYSSGYYAPPPPRYGYSGNPGYGYGYGGYYGYGR